MDSAKDEWWRFFGQYFCKKALSWMFVGVKNTPLDIRVQISRQRALLIYLFKMLETNSLLLILLVFLGRKNYWYILFEWQNWECGQNQSKLKQQWHTKMLHQRITRFSNVFQSSRPIDHRWSALSWDSIEYRLLACCFQKLQGSVLRTIPKCCNIWWQK